MAALLSTVKASQTKAYAALGALAKDILDRKLLFHDYTNLDTSPTGEETRAKRDKAKLEEQFQQKKRDSLDLLSTQRQKVERARITKDKAQNAAPKLYRTRTHRTTRPNISGSTADVAEAHDILEDHDSEVFFSA